MKRVVMIMAAALAGITILAGAQSLSPDSRINHTSIDPAFPRSMRFLFPHRTSGLISHLYPSQISH